MKVILTKDIAGVGRAGDIKDVSEGHARNFLIPKHLALPATVEMLTRVQKEEAEHQQKVQKLHQQSTALKGKIENKTFTITVKNSGTHKLYAAIHEAEIAKEISEKVHLSIQPKQVIIKQAINTLGIHDAEIKLTDSIHAKVKIEIKKQS